MRVIANLNVPKEERIEPDEDELVGGDIVLPKGGKVKETIAKCLGCQSTFAFTILDEGVTQDNEGDYYLDCPVCGKSLGVERGSGVVFQPAPTGD